MNPAINYLKDLYQQLFFTGDKNLEDKIEIEELGLSRKESVEFYCTMAQQYYHFWPEKVSHFLERAYFFYNSKPNRAAERIIKKTQNFMRRLSVPEPKIL